MREGKEKLMKDKVLSSEKWDDALNPKETWGRMSRLTEVLSETEGTRIDLQKDMWLWNVDLERVVHFRKKSIQF